MGNESKSIRKTDDGAMALLHEILDNKVKNIADIDSYYNIDGTYHFLEFVKCEGKPFDYDPNQNWQEIKGQIFVIWDFTCKADGVLWLVCYTDEKRQFKLFRVKDLDDNKIEFADILQQDAAGFKAWFQKLNSDVLKK